MVSILRLLEIPLDLVLSQNFIHTCDEDCCNLLDLFARDIVRWGKYDVLTPRSLDVSTAIHSHTYQTIFQRASLNKHGEGSTVERHIAELELDRPEATSTANIENIWRGQRVRTC